MTERHLEALLLYIREHKPFLWPALEANATRNEAAFYRLGEQATGWAAAYLGEDYARILADGYAEFVMDVNRAQLLYERRGEYENKSYAEVCTRTYANPEFMTQYHWGVYVTTFAWAHHLEIFGFFEREFVSRLRDRPGHLLDLGAGSGIWSKLCMTELPGWAATGVDISATSVTLSAEMLNGHALRDRVNYQQGDALSFQLKAPADAGISCFLLEHLEEPSRLLGNLAANLKHGAMAFVTAALTAAEIDHIREFRRESELIVMAEAAGFRVVNTFSAAPVGIPKERRFLPRSMAMVLQKRHNDIW